MKRILTSISLISLIMLFAVGSAQALNMEQLLNASYDSSTNSFRIGMNIDSFKDSTALTNAVSYPFTVTHETSGTEAAGIGVGLEFTQETTGGNEIGAKVEIVTTDVTATSEDFDFVIKLMDAGAGAAERWRLDSDGAVSQTMTGTVKTFVYQADALADDATVSLPDATTGIAMVVCNAESFYAIVADDGSVALVANTTNVAATDSDTDLCIYDGGTAAIVKNRLGTTGVCRIIYQYN